MMYRDAPITSAEHAMSLAPGTIARWGAAEDPFIAILRIAGETRTWESADAGTMADAEMVGWVALVPAQ